MGWTNPQTYTAGQVVDETDLNTEIRDNTNYLKAATPTIYVSKAAGDSPYTVPAWGYHVRIDASGGAVTVNLPTASGNQGARIQVTKTDSSVNAVTIDAYNTQTIDYPGAATLVLYSQGDTVTLVSDGTNVEVL